MTTTTTTTTTEGSGSFAESERDGVADLPVAAFYAEDNIIAAAALSPISEGDDNADDVSDAETKAEDDEADVAAAVPFSDASSSRSADDSLNSDAEAEPSPPPPAQKSPSSPHKFHTNGLRESITDETLELAFRALNDPTGSSVLLESLSRGGERGFSGGSYSFGGLTQTPGGDSTSVSDNGTYSSNADDDDDTFDEDVAEADWDENGIEVTDIDRSDNDDDDDGIEGRNSPPLLTPSPSPESPPAVLRFHHQTSGGSSPRRRSILIRQQTPSPSSRLRSSRAKEGSSGYHQKMTKPQEFNSFGSDEITEMVSNTKQNRKLKTIVLFSDRYATQEVADLEESDCSYDSWEVSGESNEDEREEEEMDLIAITGIDVAGGAAMNAAPRDQSRFLPRVTTPVERRVIILDNDIRATTKFAEEEDECDDSDTVNTSLESYFPDDATTILSFNGHSSSRGVGCCAMMPSPAAMVEEVQEEVTGTIEDAGTALEEVWNVFTLRYDEIDAFTKPLRKIKREVRKMQKRVARARVAARV